MRYNAKKAVRIITNNNTKTHTKPPGALWVAKIAKLHRKMSKIEACPPPLQVGHQALGSKSPDIGRKMGRNLSEDLFIFALHLILGEKRDEI